MARFNSVCIISQDLQKLSQFYRQVLRLEPEGDEAFLAFPTAGAGLTLCSVGLMESMAPHTMEGAGYGGAVLEFEVDAVDEEYARLVELGIPIVKPPTTQPWGLRSFWFRDPEGNIVNFYARVRLPAPA